MENHYRTNYNKLVKYMRYRVGNYSSGVADEVVQEAYVRALKYFKRYNPKRAPFEKWFNSILNNVLNQVKNEERSRGVSYEMDAVEDYQLLPVELTVLPKEKQSRFRIGLSETISLEKERDRVILGMFFFDGFRSREIAEFLVINHNTVRQVINRFREKLVEAPIGMG